MFDLGAYPGVIEGGRTGIVGDVMAVNVKLLASLDAFEEHPRGYVRTLIATPFGRAWMYIYRHQPGDAPVVPSGDWRNR
jgi:gamma-glutamylaminecyclotransferase